MGTYIPNKPKRGRSVSDTLLEAEEDHYLDCPNADFLIRAAAFALDLVFLILLYSALERIFSAAVFSNVFGKPEELSKETSAWIVSARVALEWGIFHIYYLWCTSHFGGTPAKLILGLRVLDSRTGGKLMLPRVLLREVIGKFGLNSLTVGVGFLITLYRKDHRALHDLISGSVVKKIHGQS